VNEQFHEPVPYTHCLGKDLLATALYYHVDFFGRSIGVDLDHGKHMVKLWLGN